jgi:hypothetical protein
MTFFAEKRKHSIEGQKLFCLEKGQYDPILVDSENVSHEK